MANAAVLGARVAITKYPLEVWKQPFQVNVHANLLLLQGVDPLLRKSDAGRVVILTAGVAKTPKVGTDSYAVSKAALGAMAGIYALESAGTPIRVNMVSVGPTRTEMRARAVPAEDPITLKTPEDIAPLFVELASHACTRRGEWIVADEWLKSREERNHDRPSRRHCAARRYYAGYAGCAGRVVGSRRRGHPGAVAA